MENFVVVPYNEEYKGGIGYTGPILQALQFPEGPYTKKVAEIFVRQAKSENSKLRFKIVEYVKG